VVPRGSVRGAQRAEYISNQLKKLPDVGSRFEALLNTGNLASRSGLDLSQVSGFTVSVRWGLAALHRAGSLRLAVPAAVDWGMQG
jgi:hypothetical protein